MDRIKLRCGGKRKKALFGVDGAITAAATLASAAITAAATAKAAKDQAKAIETSGKQNADALKFQNENNTKLKNEEMSMTRTLNKENQDFQRDLILSGQLQAGNENLEYKMQNGRMQVKAGGSPKKRSLNSSFFYGGARMPFKVTDGGGVLPIDIDNNGYGLYEIIGNDHDHYHKTPSGKNKTGVGIKLANGGIVEGEGNQNTNQGELMYITPNDAMFISKHSIKGFNPTEAVNNGMQPEQAFAYQEAIKDIYGIKDDGSKAKCGKRKSIRQKAQWGVAPVSHTILDNPNVTATVNVPRIISTQSIPRNTVNSNSSIGSTGSNVWNNYGGAIINSAGNVIGAGINWIGNIIAGRHIAKATERARQYALDRIDEMHGVDIDNLNYEDYAAPQTLAIVRSADTNVNPQLERIRRDAVAQKREVNRNTLSSAARQTRNAEINDRAFQRAGEQYAYKHNMDEQIKRENAQAITQNQQANADREVAARKSYLDDKFKYLAFNAEVDNNKAQLKAQINSDAEGQIASALGGAAQAGLQGLGTAFTNSANGFASTYDGLRADNINRTNLLMGVDTENMVNYLVQNPNVNGNRQRAISQVNAWKGSNNSTIQDYVNRLKRAYNIV